MRFRLSHLVLVVGALLPLGAEAVPFSNGNFASPGLPAGTQRPIGPGTEPTFWVAGGTASTSSFALFYENGLYGLPSVPLVGFGGNGTTGATLSQTFDTLAGSTYLVRFQVTPQQGAGPQSLLAQALNGSMVLASSSIDIPLLGSEAFHFYDEMFNFVAGSGATTLRFTDTSDGAAASGTNFAVGNVSVNDSGGVPPVPEPETYALMMAGLGALGFAARRRKQRAVTS